jgi:SAM-dependent methyltransferase
MLSEEDFIGWDVENWTECFRLWEPHVSAAKIHCLEIGSGPGGGSLWLASKGHSVVCSDIGGPSADARALHRKHALHQHIDYQDLDAANIPYQSRFDVILVKSVLGGIWGRLGMDTVQRAVAGIHRALKPNGKLLFAENLRSTRFHMFCRERFLGRDRDWKYPTSDGVLNLLSQFSTVDYRLGGFLGAFGRTERQRTLLAFMDHLLVPLLPSRWCYIMAGVAYK